MNKSVYDMFRDVQKKRTDCYDERSAAFITQGKLSQAIYHRRLEKRIPAAIVIKHEEGPDEVLVYTLKKESLQKADYFVYDHTSYLVYEEHKQTDKSLPYRKHQAVECNISFKFKGKIFKGYYKSSLRRKESQDFMKNQVLSPDETPILILPTNKLLKVNDFIQIQEKPFKIQELDSITNQGITYYYLERSYIRNLPEEIESIQEEMPDGQPQIFAAPAPEIVEMPELVAAREYTFTTEDAYFTSNPSVDLLGRKRTSVTFRVPFGVEEVVIEIKENGQFKEEMYKVVV